MSDRWNITGPQMAVAMFLALIAAIATSMLVARFAPWPEAERLLAGAVTFPVWWMSWVSFNLLSRRFWLRAAVISTVTVASVGATVLA